MCLLPNVPVPMEDRRQYWISSIGVINGCEFPKVGPVTRTLVLWNKSQYP